MTAFSHSTRLLVSKHLPCVDASASVCTQQSVFRLLCHMIAGVQGLVGNNPPQVNCSAAVSCLPAAGDGPSDINVVSYLQEHFTEALRAVHSEEAPGKLRESDKLNSNEDLPSQLKVKGRSRTYLLLVANLARIFRRWKKRDASVDSLDFQRGLAHLLLLSSPGSGAVYC